VDKKLEVRSSGEIRSTEGEGICEAYLTRWDTVDSWDTTFEKGAFKKSFKKRGAEGIKLIWNHEELAGKVLEVSEDSTGPKVKVQFNLNTRTGKEAFEHVKAGDVQCFSFGFTTLRDRWKNGIRSIQEVDVVECGPVVFPANEKAKITGIRAEDFDETIEENALRRKRYELIDALSITLDDIYWGPNSDKLDNILPLMDVAISKFHTAYLDWLKDWYDRYENRTGEPPRELRTSVQKVLNSTDFDDLKNQTGFTDEEVKQLTRNQLLSYEGRAKMEKAPKELQAAYKELRRAKVEALCDEFRNSGFSNVEKERFFNLLDFRKKEVVDETGAKEIINFLIDFRSRL